MKITMEMLLAAWKHRTEGKKWNDLTIILEHVEEPGMEIRHIRLARSEDAGTRFDMKDTLFLVVEEELSGMTGQRYGEGNAVFLFFSGDREGLCRDESKGGEQQEEEAVQITRIEQVLSSLQIKNYAVIFASEEPIGFLEKMEELVLDLYSWDREMTEGVYKDEDVKHFLSLGQAFLHKNYAIVDFDMNYMYVTESYRRTHQIEEGRVDKEVFQSLIIHKKFHDVAYLKKPFYYVFEEQEVVNYCANIFVDNQYIARVVMDLPDGRQRLSAGEEELFSLYAGHVQDMFRYGKLIPGKHQNDRLHNLCRQMIQGDEPEQETVQKTIGRYGWKIEEEYLVVVIRFFEEKGWDAQLKTTLPFLAVQLEQEWMGSCAVRSESEIILILNCEICMNRGKGKKDIQSAYGDLLQKMAYFVRDNVCRAGVSPVFHNFMELKQAGEAAREALRIGMVQEPELWYHLFDEIRLPYYIEQIRRELPDSMLVHPAVGVLDEYDRSQGTELALTLETFLESGMNMTKASERLYIHRTTFCRRMDHIRKLTGVNLEDPDTILSLQISYRIRKV